MAAAAGALANPGRSLPAARGWPRGRQVGSCAGSRLDSFSLLFWVQEHRLCPWQNSVGTPLSPLRGWQSLVCPNSRRAGDTVTERDGAGGVAPASTRGTILGSRGTRRVFRAGLDQHQPWACATPKYSTKELFACPAPRFCGVWGHVGASRVWPLAQRRWSCSRSGQAFDFSSMCFSLNVKWKRLAASVFMVAPAVMETHQAGAAKYQLCNCRLPLDGKHVFQTDFG